MNDDQSAANEGQWVKRTISEQVEFFRWMDALCREADRQSVEAPWPATAYMSDALDYWLVDFEQGLAAVEVLDG